MKDIHERAVEMARNHLGENTASGGGESERRMAQKALRSQIGQFNGQGVRRISASFEEEQEERILNVATYCRVSTDDMAQVTSI